MKLQLKKYTSLFLSFAFLSGLQGQAEARSLKEIQDTKTLVVGVTGNIPPFQYKAGSNLVGFEADVAKSLANGLGLEVVYKEMPVFSDLPKALADDKIDMMIATVSITSTRDKLFDFTTPYACLGASLLTTNPNLKTQNDLKGKKIGVTKNTVFSGYAQKLPFDKEIILYDTPQANMQAITTGKFDTAIGWRAMIPFISKIYNVPLQETPTLWSIPVGVMVQQKNVALRLTLNNEINKMIRDGRADTLYKKYFPNENVTCK